MREDFYFSYSFVAAISKLKQLQGKARRRLASAALATCQRIPELGGSRVHTPPPHPHRPPMVADLMPRPRLLPWGIAAAAPGGSPVSRAAANPPLPPGRERGQPSARQSPALQWSLRELQPHRAFPNAARVVGTLGSILPLMTREAPFLSPDTYFFRNSSANPGGLGARKAGSPRSEGGDPPKCVS